MSLDQDEKDRLWAADSNRPHHWGGHGCWQHDGDPGEGAQGHRPLCGDHPAQWLQVGLHSNQGCCAGNQPGHGVGHLR